MRVNIAFLNNKSLKHVSTNILNRAFKGYLRYRTIFCHKVALDAQLMIDFFYLK